MEQCWHCHLLWILHIGLGKNWIYEMGVHCLTAEPLLLENMCRGLTKTSVINVFAWENVELYYDQRKFIKQLVIGVNVSVWTNFVVVAQENPGCSSPMIGTEATSASGNCNHRCTSLTLSVFIWFFYFASAFIATSVSRVECSCRRPSPASLVNVLLWAWLHNVADRLWSNIDIW